MTGVQRVSTHRSPGRRLPLVAAQAGSSPAPRLGVLSIHLDGERCRVGCAFCYLGARPDGVGGRARGADPAADVAALCDALVGLDCAEIAVALSEPVAAHLPALRAIAAVAAARGVPLAVTTTASVVAQLVARRDLGGADPLAGATRLSISVDPRKGPTTPAFLGALARRAAAPGRAIYLIATLIDEGFARALIRGELAALVELEGTAGVALHGLKPPPAWCDRAFWLGALAALAPLLSRHLDRRLFLDCYVAARILQLGGCPARPDLSPGREFRACVYQAAADFTYRDGADLAARLDAFTPPAACPFPIR
jgi:hypothetical protein